MSEIALRFLLANLAAAIAILLVIAMRKPARAAFGARLAYSLWLLVPLAALGSLLPPRIVEIARPAPAMTASYPPPSFAPDSFPAPPVFTPADMPVIAAAPSVAIDLWMIATLLWLAGGIAMLVWQMRNQSRFMADARAGFAGPAVAGFLRPRIITPSDFEDRFDRDERQVILAHETIHLRRNDARLNALVALLRCACWFNPLVHLGAHLMRIDQELACDAVVVERHPRAKATYASALLKAQLAARPLPLGCYWPAGADHPLTERVEMLKQVAPTRMRRVAGAGALALLALGACVSSWAAQPPQKRFVVAETTLEAPTVEPVPANLLGPPPVNMPRSFLLNFNSNDPVIIRGKVVRFERDYDLMGSDRAAVWIEASQITATGGDWPADTRTRLWRIVAGSPGRWPDWADAKVIGQEVTARGYRAFDKTCQPACLASSPDWTFPNLPELAPFADATWTQDAPASAPRPALEPQPVRYAPQRTQQSTPADSFNVDTPIYLRGAVEKIDFADTTYIVFVRAENVSTDPYALAQPNSQLWALNPANYFGEPDNRQRIHDSLVNKRIDVFGYRAKDKSCTPACLIQDREIFLQPANTGFEGGFAGLPGHIVLDAVIDTSAPIQLRGTVVRFDNAEESATPHGILWVEAKSVEPAATPGAKPGTMWRVAGFPGHVLKSRFWLGAEVTVNGFNVRDKSCEPACVMVGKQILNGFSNVTTAN